MTDPLEEWAAERRVILPATPGLPQTARLVHLLGAEYGESAREAPDLGGSWTTVKESDVTCPACKETQAGARERTHEEGA